MGLTTAGKLGFCAALLFLVQCATTDTLQTTDAERRNKALQRRVSDNEAEVRRLERLLAFERENVAPEPSQETPKVPVAVLKPPPAPSEDEEDDDELYDRRQVVASSSHESMTWYQQGTALMQQDKWDPAVSAFSRFLKLDPEHVYADRAQFWIATCHYKNHEYGMAVVAFNLVVSRYPQSVKVPEAMYQAALSHLAMNQPKPAKGLLQDLLRQFPMDGMANPASRKLAEIAGRSKTF